MHKKVVAKILHDLASPLTALSFLSDNSPDFPDLKIITEDMVWRLKCLRLIFVKEKLTYDQIAPFVKNIQTNIHNNDLYARFLIVLAYVFKNKSISFDIQNNVLTPHTLFSKNDLNFLLNDGVESSMENILLKYLKEELNNLNVKILMV